MFYGCTLITTFYISQAQHSWKKVCGFAHKPSLFPLTFWFLWWQKDFTFWIFDALMWNINVTGLMCIAVMLRCYIKGLGIYHLGAAFSLFLLYSLFKNKLYQNYGTLFVSTLVISKDTFVLSLILCDLRTQNEMSMFQISSFCTGRETHNNVLQSVGEGYWVVDVNMVGRLAHKYFSSLEPSLFPNRRNIIAANGTYCLLSTW